MSNNQAKIDRREFAKRSIGAGASIAGATLLAYWMFNRDPDAGKKQYQLPDFSVDPVDGQTISIVQGRSRANTVAKAVELLGGIDRFVQSGETVVIKPNIAFATPAMLGATAHPDTVAAVVKLCYTAGARKVIVTDNPINDAQSCFRLSGIAKAATQAGAELVYPKNHLFKEMSLTEGQLIRNWPIYFEPFADADKLIGITPVKHHQRSGASMTMKNFYGLLGGPRNIFHQDINTIITELSMLVKPTFVILDGTTVMMTNGPTGGSLSDLRQADTMIASTDMVAADTFGASLLGLKPIELPYLGQAERAGSGTTDYESLKPARTQVTEGAS